MASRFTFDVLTGAESTLGSIKSWVQHSAIDPEQILEEAQRFIFKKLRVREMIVALPIVIESGEEATDLPDGFLDPVHLTLDGDADPLDYVQENLLQRVYDETTGEITEGRPSRYSIWDEQFQFDVSNDSDDDLNASLVYYVAPDLLAADNQSNFLCSRYPTLLRRACLAFGYEARKRTKEFADTVQLVEKEIFDVNVSSDFGRRGQIMR